jgi:iron complex outermembrane receptor protein
VQDIELPAITYLFSFKNQESMKNKILIIILLCTVHFRTAASDRYSPVILTGKITDKETGNPIVGVNVYLPELKAGTITDTAGNYILKTCPLQALRYRSAL